MRVPRGSAGAFVRVAAIHGVAVAGTREFAVDAGVDDRIRIPFTAPEAVLREGLRRLGVAWQEYSSRLAPR